MADNVLLAPVEIRASESGPELYMLLLQEGRAATGGRAELFAPGAATWPGDGIDIMTVHRGAPEVRGFPVRGPRGELEVRARATPAIQQAVAEGKAFASVEFHPLQETRTAGGVREIQRALVTGAALVSNPEYGHTRAEIRTRRRYYI